jgi:integrase
MNFKVDYVKRNYYLRNHIWWVKFHYPKGNIVQRSLSIKNKKLIFARADQVINDYKEEFDKKKELTLFTWIEQYIAIKNTSKRNKTFPNQLNRLSTIKNYFGDLPLSKISEARIREFLDKMMIGILPGQKGRKLSNTSFNRWHSLLTNVFKKAEERKIPGLTINPMILIEQLQEHPDNRRFTLNEINKLILASKEISEVALPVNVNQKYFYHLFMLLLTGCRLSEALNLKWNDLFISEKKEWFFLVKDPKNSIPKKIFLSHKFVGIIEPLKGLSEYVIPFKDHHSYLVFKPWHKVQSKANVFGRLHAIRHSIASLLDADGATEGELMKIMGWKDRAMIDIYVKAFRDNITEKINILTEKFKV